MATLQHRNIITVFDVGETDDGQPYMAMEYLRGETLSQIIRNKSPLPLARKMRIMSQVSDGLDYAHRGGVVHRDIKPPNIMVGNDDLVKIVDFGIAHGLSLAQSDFLVGTPSYMAPEAIMGGRLDSRCDIFSVGAVFYELLTYRRVPKRPATFRSI
jgi:serine/threonine protein kinase